ncbi:MAG TPA: SPO1 DNA polymerase [Betaproteobacteria bacterium]|nr:SPO1 DNA polymerase [Betaproteobacteria bacterium]
MLPGFSTQCRQCTRLAAFLDEVKSQHPDYHAAPVPPFGDSRPRLLIVGLAPGMHGANRTGRPFTGDHAGILLYRTLHQFGFATHPASVSRDDGLTLVECRITNAVKCLPPQNKPETAEIKRCNPYLTAEIEALTEGAAVLALGNIAHQSVLRALGLRNRDAPFAHGAVHSLGRGLTLYDSYHCSRYNTQTRRLTAAMFASVFAAIQRYLHRDSPCLTSTPE